MSRFAFLVAMGIATIARAQVCDQVPFAVPVPGSPTSPVLTVDDLSGRRPTTFAVRGAAPRAAGKLLVSEQVSGEGDPQLGGVLYPGDPLFDVAFQCDEQGSADVVVDVSSLGPELCELLFTAQAILRDPVPGSLATLSSAVQFTYGTVPTLNATVVTPADGSIVNDATPKIMVQFGNGLVDCDTIVVRLDGEDITEGLILLGQGVVGDAPFLDDGLHLLEVGAFGVDGTTLVNDAIVFTTSTGGGPTVLTGLVLDPVDDTPIVGAEIFFEGDPSNVVLTDADGRYTITDAPVGGTQILVFDTRDLVFPGFSYPLYKRPIDLVPGALNETDPCYLPKIEDFVAFTDLAAAGIFDCATGMFLQDYVLTNTSDPDLDGVELLITAGTYVELLDGQAPCEGALSITEVDEDRAPSNLPENIDPPLLITVQPSGMRFLDAPGGERVSLPVTFPNRMGDDGEFEFPVGGEFQLLSVDHDTGEFQQMGTMLVDGEKIVTIEGGLEGGSWHAPLPPEVPPQDDWPNPDPPCDVNPSVSQLSGYIQERFGLPRRLLFDEPWGMDLVYSSRRVTTKHVERIDFELPGFVLPPKAVKVSATFDGVLLDERVFQGGGALSLPLVIDTTGWGPGEYSIDVGAGAIYGFCKLPPDFAGVLTPLGAWSGGFKVPPPICPPFSPVFAPTAEGNSSVHRELIVERRDDESFGRGWTLSGDDRLVLGPTPGVATVFEGGGGVTTFDDVILGSERGLRLRMYDDVAETAMQGLYANSPPVAFTLRRPGLDPVIVDEAVVPSAHFFKAPGPYLLHVGEDGIQQTLDFTDPQGDDLVLEAPNGSDAFGVRLEGFFDVPEAGEYQFSALTPDGFALQVDDAFVMDKLTAEGGALTASEPIALPEGLVPVVMSYVDLGGDSQLSLFANGPELSGGVLGEDVLFSGGTATGASGSFVNEGPAPSRIVALPEGGWVRDFADKGRVTFDVDGRVVRREDRRGRVTTYARDADGRLLSVTDPVGGVTELLYNGERVSEIRELSTGRSTLLSYGGIDGDQLVAITDATGETWSYGYDDADLLTSTQEPGLGANTHHYDELGLGRYVGVTYADGAQQTFRPRDLVGVEDVDDNPLYPPLVILASEATALHTDGEGKVRTIEIDNATGTMTRRDPLGRETKTTYENRLPRRVTAPDGTFIEMEWDEERGLPIGVVLSGDPETEDDDRRGEITWHPEYAWVTGMTIEPGTPLERAISFDLDPATGDVLAIHDPLDGVTTMTYEPLGALASITDPNGLVRTITRDPVTRSTTTDALGGKVETSVLDAAGREIQNIQPDGTTTTYTRDALGRLLAILDPEGGVTTYTYTPRGQLASVVDAKQPAATDSYEYDVRGRLVRSIDPAGNDELWVYDDRNLVTQYVDRNGSPQFFTWDDAGQPVERVTPETTTTYDFDDRGRLVRATDATSDVALDYSFFGELLSEVELGEAVASALVHEYDVLGQRTSTTVSVGGAVVKQAAYGYDGAGRQVSSFVDVTVPGGVLQQVAAGYAWDGGGRRTSVTRPGDVVTQRGYDPVDGDMLELTTTIAGLASCRDTYSYDDKYDLTGRGEERTLLADVSATIDHDGLHRLVSATFAGGSGLPGFDASPYDGVGNRNSDAWTYGPSDELLSTPDHTYAYDDNGARVARFGVGPGDPVWTYDHDELGRLVGVASDRTSVSTYRYDALGRLVDANGVRLVPSLLDQGWHAIEEGGQVTALIQGAIVGEYVAAVDATGVTSLVQNLRGDIVQAVRDGIVIGEWRYGPFGERLEASGAIPGLPSRFAFGLSAQLYDEAADLHAMGLRFLDSGTASFLERDPEWMALSLRSVAMGSSRYGYAAMSPYRFGDVTGRSPKGWCIAKEVAKTAADCLLSAAVTAVGVAGAAVSAPATTVVAAGSVAISSFGSGSDVASAFVDGPDAPGPVEAGAGAVFGGAVAVGSFITGLGSILSTGSAVGGLGLAAPGVAPAIGGAALATGVGCLAFSGAMTVVSIIGGNKCKDPPVPRGIPPTNEPCS